MSEAEKKLTDSARTALDVAKQQAEVLGQTYIGTEHMVLGIMIEGKSAAALAIRRQNLHAEAFLQLIEQHIGRGTHSKLSFRDLSTDMQRILHELLSKRSEAVDCKQILLRILQEPRCAASLYLKEAGCDLFLLQDMLGNLQTEEPPRAAKKSREREGGILRRYSTDLTDLAREDKLDPVLGRDKEMEQLLRVLARRNKNNPCLVGDAGVGKTAIVEGLAQQIVLGTVPDSLKEKHILSLDMTALLAGSKFRGEFEERIQSCLNEAINRGDCILFIDEIHILTEAGSAEGATSAANLLKPQLARGDLQVIGATTWTEYKRFIEKDAALSRRFQRVLVEEPDEATAILMLQGLTARYEQHHGVRIPLETVEAAVRFSKRYLQDRRLPDKALDLMDEAAAKAAQDERKQFFSLQKQLRAELEALDEEKRHFLKSNDLVSAAAISDKEGEIRQKLRVLRPMLSLRPKSVTVQDVAELIAEQSGVDSRSITQEEGERLLHFEERLSKHIIGQEQAVHAVAEAIRRQRAGLNDPRRPMGSFLFMGPSGVGKTKLCKVLAKELFGSEEALLRLDMSEFAQEHMAARLIGAPPGYVGYQEGGRLTEAVRQRPYSLILFDELEKAHPRVCDLLLQILEEGELKDGEGKCISFRSCVIIMTSNVGALHFAQPAAIGFGEDREELSYEKAAARSREDLKKQFRPEFIDRIDEIIVFHWLDEKAREQIGGQLLEELNTRLQAQGLCLRCSSQALQQLCSAEKGEERKLGARPLRQKIRRKIEQPLAQQLISGAFHPGETIVCDCVQGTFVFRPEETAKEQEDTLALTH